jgi:type IV pilus secretin PilQ/predicted competence protein
MKIKTLLLILVILSGIVTLSLSLQANPNIVIKDIEYLTGEDFVQLHFKIDQMIPIPDVFYPEKDDNTRIVMRMNNVVFEPAKDLLKFESSIIDSVKVNRHPDNTTAMDIDIQLKEQVNYRVFTNQKGLFIEFPQVKQVSSAPPQPVPAQPSSPAGQVEEAVESDAGKVEYGDSEPQNLPAENQDPRNRIKNLVISEKTPNRIKFRILMKEPVADFNVIPIPQEPFRLAIDFQNTRSRPILKEIHLLNVKQIRGAYNSPTVFRIVFDLDYLKKYKVSPVMKGKVLEVEFFNESEDVLLTQNNSATPANIDTADNEGITTPASSAPIDVEVKEKGVVVSNAPEIPENIEVAVQEEESGVAAGNPSAAEETAAAGKPEKQSHVVISNIDHNGAQASGITVTQGQGPESVQGTPGTQNTNNDFFDNEKARVAPLEAEKSTLGGDVSSATSASPNAYVRQTIDGGETKYTGELMSFNFHSADLKDVIKIIATVSGLNIVLDPAVSGRVTSRLNQVPWDQALELFLKINGLDMVQEGNIIRIGKVEQLASEAQKRRALKDAQQMEGDLTVFTRTLSFAKVGEINSILKKQLSKRGEIIEDERSNTLIISEVPSRIDVIDRLIDTLDTPNPQVSIEARIVESTANYIESFGIQWGYNFIMDAAYGNQTTLKFPNSVQVSGNQYTSTTSPLEGPLGGYAVNLPATGAQSGTVFSLGNIANTFRLDVALSAMERKGEGKIISAPKTTTQNNMEASVMQGQQIPVQTIQNNTVTVQYRPAALELKVTPQITAEGTIITQLEINNNSADFGNLVNGIPPITTQAIKTTVMVPDGGTIVIGGMYRVEKSTTREGVPFFSKIPLLGSLFRNRNQRSEQRELLVFITPRIIK